MKTILLYGHLGKKFGKVHKLAVSSPAEAIRALSANYKDFAEYVANSSGAYKVVIGGSSAINPREELRNPVSDKESIRIVPVIQGAGGGGGLLQVVIGAVLIIGSTLLPTGPWTPYMQKAGWAMVLSGVATMLFAPPAIKAGDFANREAPENKPSYAFDGAVNTVAQGNPIPVCYGRLIVGSQIISAGFSVEQIA